MPPVVRQMPDGQSVNVPHESTKPRARVQGFCETLGRAGDLETDFPRGHRLGREYGPSSRIQDYGSRDMEDSVMRPTLMQFKAWHLIVAVAIAGVTTSLVERSMRFRRIAAEHRYKAIDARPYQIEPRTNRPVPRRSGSLFLNPRTMKPLQSLEQWHDEIAEKYGRARPILGSLCPHVPRSRTRLTYFR